MTELVLGPVVRFVDPEEATVWVETDRPCEVQVLGAASSTFAVGGHHYALVCIGGLEPGSSHEYEVLLDGERRWPEPGSPFPPSAIRSAHDATSARRRARRLRTSRSTRACTGSRGASP